MTEQFFGKELAARKIEAIPGMIEFDIPVHGDNRGWFKENFQKEKMLPLGFPESFFAEGKLQNNVSFSHKNVLRGLHAEPWDKYTSVADEGKVLGHGLIYVKVTALVMFTKQLSMLQKVSLSHVVSLTVSKYCLIKYHTATWLMTIGHLNLNQNTLL